MTTTTVDPVSGLDDLLHEVTLTDESDDSAITSGTVTVRLCLPGTVTAIGSLAEASKALTHVAAGLWQGVHDAADVATAIASVPTGGLFTRVLVVDGITSGRLLGTCRKVAVVGP